MIDGSEKRNRQLAFELKNSHVCEKRSKKKKQLLLGFCDILNNQGLGKCYQPRPSARLITLIPDITKT